MISLFWFAFTMGLICGVTAAVIVALCTRPGNG